MRSSIAGLATLCFALSAFTWGWMPGCAPGVGMGASATHGHATHAPHTGHTGIHQGNTGCAVHLCCIQLADTSGKYSSSGRLSPAEPGIGPVTQTTFVLLRASHSLPFAQAPPSTPA